MEGTRERDEGMYWREGTKKDEGMHGWIDGRKDKREGEVGARGGGPQWGGQKGREGGSGREGGRE